MSAFWLLFEDHLSDNIQSVRGNAACAVGLLHSKQLFSDKIHTHIEKHIDTIKNQTRADESDGDE